MLLFVVLGILVFVALIIVWVVHIVTTIVGIIMVLMVIALLLLPFAAILSAHLDLRENGDAGRGPDVVLGLAGVAFIAIDVAWLIHGLTFDGGPKWWYFWTAVGSAGLFSLIRSGMDEDDAAKRKTTTTPM